MNFRLLACAAVAVLLIACEDPVGVQVGETWTLQDVDGRPLPGILDVAGSDAVSIRYLRTTARTIEFVSADTAVYAEANDIAEVRRALAGYAPQPIAAYCTTRRVGYQRDGRRVILDFPATDLFPVAVRDTLRLSGPTLVQRMGPDSTGQFRRLAYARRAPESPVCPPA